LGRFISVLTREGRLLGEGGRLRTVELMVNLLEVYRNGGQHWRHVSSL